MTGTLHISRTGYLDEVLAGRFILLFYILTVGHPLAAQKLCPERLALLPASIEHREGHSQIRRFEIRECPGGFIQVLQFEQNAAKPARVVETGESWPPYVSHIMNTLVLQNVGGVSTRVYIFTFKSGRASEPVQRATTGYPQVRMSDDGTAVIVHVPAEHTMNGILTRSKEYRFPIE
jgi:hypothetical protein